MTTQISNFDDLDSKVNDQGQGSEINLKTSKWFCVS